MDANIIENLLNESESDYLDFKQEQYRFEGATDEEKSELLKDILAFANAWRRTDAYILIGVKDGMGGRGQVLGISNHFDDASIQQFVNSKVQKPITFSYSAYEFEEKQLGIINIPVQDRPYYLKQNYGKLKKNVVYLRRGSATAEAEPDEIVKMGYPINNSFLSQIPIIDCEFANPDTRELFGKEIEVTSEVLHTTEPIPDFSPGTGQQMLATLIINNPNRDFYRELYKYFDSYYLLKAVSLRLINTGKVTAYNTRVEITVPADDLQILHENEFPDLPDQYTDFITPINRFPISSPQRQNNRLTIERHGNSWHLSIYCGSIQPKAEDWLEEMFFIGSKTSQDIQFEAKVFADNAPDPIRVSLCMHFRTEELKLTLNELLTDYHELCKQQFGDEEE